MMIPTIIYIDCTKFPDPEFGLWVAGDVGWPRVVKMTTGELVEDSVKTKVS